MDIGYKLKNENPKKKVNFLNKLFFGWMVEIVKKGTRKTLELKDLYKALDKDKSVNVGNQLEKHWNTEIIRAREKNDSPSLIRAIRKTFFCEFMLYGLLWFALQVVIRGSQPIVLAALIKCFSVPFLENKNNTYIYSVLLVSISTCQIFVMHHMNFGLASIGMRIRVATSSLIYKKITRLNQKSLGQTAAGQIVNLLANDVSRFDAVVIPLHAIWVLPFQLVFITMVIWQSVGISTIAGITVMFAFSVPIQIFLAKHVTRLRASISKKTDRRVKLMNEIISGMQVIKMYAWEKPFEMIVRLARADEIKDITSASYLRGIFASSMVFLDRTALATTLISYVLLGNNISSDIVFSVAQSFNILQSAVAIWLPMAISQGAEALVSISRLQDFLLLEERGETTIDQLSTKGVVLSNIDASWGETGSTLKNISLRIPPGTLCAIVGPVGAGKTSLLQLLLGELPGKRGKIQMGGSVSYSCQEPWLFQSSVRNNILFGRPYDKALYDDIVRVCALQKDFEQLPQGDKTVVGERGVSLSGGQRARINLARAVYRQTDIYLFDDPLSAVDTHVGKHLFEECINKHLRGKIRILVTHQLQYLKKANFIVVLNEGKIEAQGTFQELSKSKLDFTKLLAQADETTDKHEADITELADVMLTASVRKASTTKSIVSETMEEENEVQEEESGKFKSQPFKNYLLATKHRFLLAFLVTLFIVAQLLCAGTDLWVAYWTSQEEARHSNKTIIEETISRPVTERIEVHVLGDAKHAPHTYSYSYRVDTDTTPLKTSLFDELFDHEGKKVIIKTNYAMYFYGALIAASILLTLSRSFLFFKMCMLSSTNLHAQIFHSLLKAPMRFFDTNPSGRILNRFSKDIGAVDEVLPNVLLYALQIILVMAGVLVNIAVANVYIIIAMVMLGAVFLKLRSWYTSTAKVLKHLEAIAKSPVFSHVNSTLKGITTIRASNAEFVLTQEFDEHQDVHTSAWYLTIAVMYTFGLWLDIICITFSAAVISSLVVLHKLTDISGSMVGLAISQALVLTGMLQFGMRQTAEVINQLTSVERVLEYTNIDEEGPFETPKENVLQNEWPSEGQIEFKNLSLNYAEDEPPVLNNLDFSIVPGEKVGIVGRTGAGKSSLITALFRLAPTKGSILIDGVDTQTIGLNDLRKNISIIPQEPVLFSATLRYNLDPFNEFNDHQVWNALEQVELKDAVDSLDFIVSESGSNFSLGQRQLVCLARAALRQNKILILDEATANVDLRTDSFIQSTIRERFKGCTVLTIAHRLNTIMDSDKVLVMNYGKMVEFDHPHKLLQISDGHFHKLVLETGPVMSMQLKDIAMAAYENKIEKF